MPISVHEIGILFIRGIYRHAKLIYLFRQHLNTLFWVVFVFSFPYSSFVIVCSIAGMSFGVGSGSSYHSGNGVGVGVGSPLQRSSSNKGGFLGSSANERPAHQVDYVEKDPKGRYVRVIHSTFCYYFFIEIFNTITLLE